MTLDVARKPGASDGPILWSSPEGNLWIANHGGEFAGMVEFSDGHFLASDSTGVLINSFADIPSAKAAITAQVASRNTLLGAVTSIYHHLGAINQGIDVARASKHYRRSA
ncbi:MAG: hypothetical protein JWQ43_2134 [Glaciihabitans sp.]|nr:hypothetical protein [Glaciihabitans sp.]